MAVEYLVTHRTHGLHGFLILIMLQDVASTGPWSLFLGPKLLMNMNWRGHYFESFP